MGAKSANEPIKVAIVGGGCASVAAAFELSRPQHHGKYAITIYQVGWRLGGKGASGRGPANRIEEHGLHVWMGFYENAFRLLRECYAELSRDPRKCRFADWRDAFTPEPINGVLDRLGSGAWNPRLTNFPPTDGLPGDPLSDHNPFSIQGYLLRGIATLRVLLGAAQLQSTQGSFDGFDAANFSSPRGKTVELLAESMSRLLKYGIVASFTGLIEAMGVLQVALEAVPGLSEGLLSRFCESLASTARAVLQPLVERDDEIRWIWEITDLVIASILGILRFGLLTDPRGFDAIDGFEMRQWLAWNGASEGTLNSALLRGCYDLGFAYEDGDEARPAMAAGQGIRGALRMFFTYRGSIFWKMRAGMGDVVFAPFYELLRKRNVRFEFFHRLENVKLASPDRVKPGERCYVEALEFDVQARIKGGMEYQPLIDLGGLPCWPSKPYFDQLVDGQRMAGERWDFESHWDRRKVGTRTLHVGADFDAVILGVGLGAIPYVCRELINHDRRWRDMVTHCKTVATQAFQIWMREDVEQLGWRHNQCTVTAFERPFDTWADMRHLIPEETWSTRPRAIAYFCSVLPDAELPPETTSNDYPAQCSETVRRNAIEFLNRSIRHLWPRAVRRDGFRFDLLMDFAHPSEPSDGADESAFDSQYWTANVNPSDRYCLTLPGTVKYRISPLDNNYDNFSVIGDWTDCGFNQGCVEAAVMSGRLAAHAISGFPRLDEIVGYDHP
jgi:uncharacterized protein with NAD-binding domain and iron-sulfur cluster